MKLTSEQEKIISDYVNSQGLTIPTLRDDVIDHLCCVVESEMARGKSFGPSLEAAILDLAPNGLEEIQQKTVFLLNAKRVKAMKRLMYSIGLIGAILLTVGIAFKLLRMPGGNPFFMFGFLILFLFFIPLATINRYKVSLSKALSVRLKLILGGIAAVATGLSGLFKLFHLQGAELLLLLGAFVFAFGFLPFYFFTMYKKSVS